MAPVGSFESLAAAIQGGADSVYFGIEGLNMRSRSANNFTIDDLYEIVKICQPHQIKTYLTVNTIIYDNDLARMHEIIDAAKAANISAIIAADVAAMTYANQIGVEVHLSTQLNISNIESLKFYAQFADVVVLARELNLEQVKEIHEQIQKQEIKGPKGELIRIEMFCHGALCMAVSGKCYLSLHEMDSSANRGACNQICRRGYIVKDKETDIELEIDNQYIMSPKDLKTIHFMNKMIEAGVQVFKIEGRARGAEYVRIVTECYKEAAFAYCENQFTEEKIADWNERLKRVFNRGFWNGYYLGQRLGEWSDRYGNEATEKKMYIGKVVKYFSKLGVAEFLIETQNLQVGDKVLITGPTTGALFLDAEEIRVDLKVVDEAVRGERFSMKVPEKVRPSDKLFKLIQHSLLVCLIGWLSLFSQISVAQNGNVPTEKLPADSIAVVTDSIAKPKSNAIDAPINYTAKDSIVMTMDGRNMIYMFGNAEVQYGNRNLTGEYIEVDADSSIVYATFGLDSIGNEFGYPVFKEGETEYEMKKARYNFRTKKMFIGEVITQQGEGFITARETKKMPNDDLFMRNGRYTTCDDHDNPHFYLQLTRLKLQPGKNVISGPAYLVVEDVPLPVAIPFGFFPFKGDYSSGIIMPTYGDELRRGFSLRNGGYYFAFNDYMDMALTGEIFTRGSWGVNARSTYRKRYKFGGSFNAGYLVSVMGEKGDPDYQNTKSTSLTWTHAQDAKANPFGTFSASVNFSTSAFNRNSLETLFSDRFSENTKSSRINYTYRPSNSPFSFSTGVGISQITRDTTLSMTLPDLTINMRDVYPLRRKEQIGAPKWYENIRMSYSGQLSNSISGVKENQFFEKNIIKDWRNGMLHRIPISASFNLFKNIMITPSVNYTERWYTSKITQSYDMSQHRVVQDDPTYGFYRIYDYNGQISANTKLYGMFKPWRMFGKWTEKTQIRHVFTPSVSFTGAPDFGAERFGYWNTLTYFDHNSWQLDTLIYSPFRHHQFGVPNQGRTGSMSFSLDNNLEMKVPIANTDSTRKISLIDNLRANMSYNFLADSMNWSDLNVSVRFKWSKALTFTLQGSFDLYTYQVDPRNENRGIRVNTTRLEAGKGIGRLRGTGTALSYSLNNEAIKKLFSIFSGNKTEEETDTNSKTDESASDEDEDRPRTSLRQAKKADGVFDSDGYTVLNIPWNLSFSYSMSIGYDTQNFDRVRKEYPYRINQVLGISGMISPTRDWSFNFNTSYDFDTKKFATLMCSISRRMHCWQMSASMIPIGPWKSYSFSIAVSSSLLQDLKYSQSSNFRDAMNWGY